MFLLEPNNHAVYLDVKQYSKPKTRNSRSKERAEISEVHARLRSKGTGIARAGSTSGVFRGGGHVRPRPRNHSMKQ
ncbi:50S ribosomal protein L4 [Xanthomarina gelatinilytica]|uniref:50S ribosomal protein L4 n=1 Tax=Xanthomarina gelatinilytica TaxID=1137281 RepID=UPI003AA7FF9D